MCSTIQCFDILDQYANNELDLRDAHEQVALLCDDYEVTVDVQECVCHYEQHDVHIALAIRHEKTERK